MTQHESFPGRPRGRRGRHSSGEPQWQGHDAPAQDQREFPDLSPIRPRDARTRDGRRLPGQPAPQGGYADGSYPAGDHPGGAHSGRGQAPWPDQSVPVPQYQAQQVAPHPEPQSQPQPSQPPQRRRRQQDDETPSWAEPDSDEEFSERWHRRGREARREEQQASHRKHRRLLIAGGSVIALAIAVTVYLVSGGPGAANLGFGSFVTNFLPGELQQVPDPCTTLPAGTLNQYLPGKPKEAAPPLNSGQSTECSWTLDNPPMYRVLDVQYQAYSPSGLASGNGSATFAAEDAFASFENGYAKPGKQTGLASSKVTDLSGMPGGTDTSAFQATEVFDRGGATQDLAYVYVRYRNVILRVMAQGLNQSSGGKNYSVAMGDLTTAANTVAKEMASQIAK